MSYNPLNKIDKRCGKCGVRKPVADFRERSDSTDGFHGTCSLCYQIESKRRYKPKKQRVNCEFCGIQTTAEDHVCSKCSKESLKMFESFIYNHSASTQPKADQLRYFEDAYKNAYSVETRLRFKRIITAMRGVMADENSDPNEAGIHGKQTLALGGEVQAQRGAAGSRQMGGVLELQQNQERAAV